MFRISPQHLCWALENLVEGNVVNRIKVNDDVKHWARVALDRMLEINVDHVPAASAMVAAGGRLQD
jgi:quinolinate synthase